MNSGCPGQAAAVTCTAGRQLLGLTVSPARDQVAVGNRQVDRVGIDPLSPRELASRPDCRVGSTLLAGEHSSCGEDLSCCQRLWHV